MKKPFSIFVSVLMFFVALPVMASQPVPPDYCAVSGVFNKQQINDNIFFSTNWGIYCSNLDGSSSVEIIAITEPDTAYYYQQTGIPFAGDENYIYYCGFHREMSLYGTIRCDWNGENKEVIASGLGANKLSLVGKELFYSSITTAGKIDLTNLENTVFISTNTARMPGGKEGTHFIVNNRLIITDYATPDGYEKFGERPTIIMDLDGTTVNVWKDTVVTTVVKTNGKIYANIEILDKGGYNTISRGCYLISNNFKTYKHVAAEIKGGQLEVDATPISEAKLQTVITISFIVMIIGIVVLIWVNLRKSDSGRY